MFCAVKYLQMLKPHKYVMQRNVQLIVCAVKYLEMLKVHKSVNWIKNDHPFTALVLWSFQRASNAHAALERVLH